MKNRSCIALTLGASAQRTMLRQIGS